MKYFGAFLFLCALALLWALSAPSVNLNFRLTMVVDTPDGPRSASVVQSERYAHSPISPFIGGGSSMEVRGEALVLKLDDTRYLFTVLPTIGVTAGGSFDDAGRLADWRKGSVSFYWAFLKLKYFTRGAIDVSERKLPTIVSFQDLDEPKSVFLVDPGEMDATLGEGYVFREMTVEITRDRMDKGTVEKVLPWLLELAPNRLNGERFGSFTTLAGSLSAYSFSSELFK